MPLLRARQEKPSWTPTRWKSAVLLQLLGLIALFVVFIQIRDEKTEAHSLGGSSIRSKKLLPWRPGLLDIHHLQVGSSVSSFVIMPDGTTALIDCGDLNVQQALRDWKAMGPPFDSLNLRSPHPNDSKTPAGWVVEYLEEFWPKSTQQQPSSKQKKTLDYLLVTHFHADHIGDGSPRQTDRSKSSSGNYILSGIPELVSKVNVKKIIDRGSPMNKEADHIAMEDATIKNYLQFMEENQDFISFEQFQVGSADQVKMQRRPHDYDFHIRVLKSNLQVVAIPHDPHHPAKDDITQVKTIENSGDSSTAEHAAHGDENTMSAAFVFEYGNFRYYEGGDQEIIRSKNGDIVLDTIGPTASAAGKVDVATLNHHGHGVSKEYLTDIDPLIMILQGWSSDQPPKRSIEMIASMPYKTNDKSTIPRKIFATDMFQNRLDEFGPELSKLFASTSGHTVVRVHPPPPKEDKTEPQMFEVLVLDGNRKIKAHHGHFPVRRTER